MSFSSCECNYGFEGDGTPGSCKAIPIYNECAMGTDTCHEAALWHDWDIERQFILRSVNSSFQAKKQFSAHFHSSKI